MPRRWVGVILAAGVVLGCAMVAIAPASAQTYDPRYPVCMTLTEWGGSHVECSFTSIPQCNATAAGRSAQCGVNPFYGYEKRSPR